MRDEYAFWQAEKPADDTESNAVKVDVMSCYYKLFLALQYHVLIDNLIRWHPLALQEDLQANITYFSIDTTGFKKSHYPDQIIKIKERIDL